MRQIFPHEESVTLIAATVAGASFERDSAMDYDEQVRAIGDQAALAGYPYLIETSAGESYCGRVIAYGRLPRVCTDDAATYVVYWGDEALSREDWT